MHISSPSYPPTPHLKRVMLFIDGGYLRKILENYYRENFKTDPTKLINSLKIISQQMNATEFFPYSKLEILRIYYYDGLPVDTNDPKYTECVDFFNRFKFGFKLGHPLELKFGRLIKGADNKYRQKGVDVFLSIDLVVKAFQDHYDIAVLIAGDDDFIDAVKVVKDLSGKRIIGLYKQDETSTRLIDAFDFKFPSFSQHFFEQLELFEMVKK